MRGVAGQERIGFVAGRRVERRDQVPAIGGIAFTVRLGAV